VALSQTLSPKASALLSIVLLCGFLAGQQPTQPPPSPAEFKSSYIALHFRFLYNPYPDFEAEDAGAVADSRASVPILPAQGVPEKSAKDGASQNSSWSVLSVPGKGQTRVEDPEIIGNTQGVDFQPYIESSVLPMIRATWYRLALKSKETTGGDATLQFTILKDGSVADV